MRSTCTNRHDDDLPTAIRHLELALEQRRRWSGPTLPVLLPLIRAHVLSGQYESVLELCLPAPLGKASHEEVEHPHIRRSVLYAARFAGRHDLIDQLAAKLGDSTQDRIAKLRVGVLHLAREDKAALWLEEIRRAVADADYDATVPAAFELASLGHDERPHLLPLVDKSIIPAHYLDLIEALLAARTDLDSALPTLRSLARRDSVAADYLRLTLATAGRHSEVADECLVLYEQFGNPEFLITRAETLIREDDPAAEAAAVDALQVTSGFPAERARLLTYLAAKAADGGDWNTAERRLTEVFTLKTTPTSKDVWNLVLTQVNQGKLRRAASTIAEHRPPVTSRDEAELWFRANSAVVWDEARASEALSLARLFNDPQLSTALLGHIISATHGVPESPEIDATTSDDDPEDDSHLDGRRRIAQGAVPAELHRQAFAVIESLVNEFGDATGVTVLRGEPDQLVDQMKSQLQEAATRGARFKDLIAAGQEARLPRGFLATVRGQSYATSLVQRTLGALVSGAADDDEHQLEVQSAVSALGRPVVVEAATLLVLTIMSSRTRFEGQFPTLFLPAAAMLDVHRATFDIRRLAGSPGSAGWDQSRGSLTFWELGEAEFTRQLRRAQAVEDLAQHLTVRTPNDLGLFPGFGQDPKHASWLGPIQLAYDQDVALWSDDLGLRRLARGVGVACFGTPALVDALRDRALLTAGTREAQDTILHRTAADNLDLARDLVVDVALHLDDLVQIAAEEDWQLNACGPILSRASWWAWQPTPLQDLMTIYQQVGESNPDALPNWRYAAMVGAARAFKPEDLGAKILAAIALLGYGGVPSVDTATSGILTARVVATELGLPDPVAQLAAAVTTLARSGQMPHDPDEFVSAVFSRL